MGCGKSTFIKEKGLEMYTLSTDTLRLLFNSKEMTTEYTEMIPQFNNKKVWELLFSILEERMKKGELTIIDAVHPCKEDFTPYKKLAEKYRYRLYVVDFTQIPIEEVYKRNENRESYKVVPKSSIDRVYKAFAKEEIPSSFKVILPEQVDDILTTKPKEMNQYEKIHVFGDIHGCLSTLKEYFEKNPIQEQEAYIFVGDYFDRGIENYETLQYLKNLMDKENMIFLIGNHEDKLYKYACDDSFKMDYDIKKTMQEFETHNLKKSEIRGFIKKLSQISYIQFGDFTYLITHGGIPYFPKSPLDFYSTNSFIYGIDKYEVNIDEIYNDYMEKEDKKVYQIHGHRNYHKVAYNQYNYSINLEGNIENGGCLRVLTIDKKGNKELTEIENHIYNKNLEEETKVYNLITELRKNKYIYEKELNNHISSFNFTKEAFYNKIWNHMTTQARGLFIDTQENKIVARSYNKFFNSNEREETKIEKVIENVSYPVQFYLKYNGFLGILSLQENDFYFATKSTDEGDYVEYFKTIFYKTLNDTQMKKIKEKLKAENVTFVFEVIDPQNDPHMIKYDAPKIVLLDAIKNTTTYQKIKYEDLKEFADKNKIDIKQIGYTVNTKEEFLSIYEEITKKNYQYNQEYIEGFVIEDAKGYMLKIKTDYYMTWKYLRSKMEKSLKTNKYQTDGKNTLETNFLNYLEKKYGNKEVDEKEVSIIEEREDFLKETKYKES